VYVTYLFGNLISQYSIDADGVLAPLSTPSVALPEAAKGFAIDPTGRYLYSSNMSAGTISQFSIGANGALNPMSPPAVASVAHSFAVTVDPSGHNLYVASSDVDKVWQFEIGQDGTLSPQSIEPAGLPSYSMNVDPLGRSVYMSDSTSLSQYLVDASGALTQVDSAGGVPNLVNMRSDATGTFAYVISAAEDDIYQFKVDKNGLLIPLSVPTIGTGAEPRGIAITKGH
jgi:6-phosphogluconolactonase